MATSNDLVFASNRSVLLFNTVFGDTIRVLEDGSQVLRMTADAAGGATFNEKISVAGGVYGFDKVGSGTADRLDLTGLLDLSGSNDVLEFQTVGSLGSIYVIADYGPLAGQSDSVVGLPNGYWLDYAYLGLNLIALVPRAVRRRPARSGPRRTTTSASTAARGLRWLPSTHSVVRSDAPC